MISLQQATGTAAELLDRKIDLWLTTHSKYKRDAVEVEHLRTIAINILSSPLIATHPDDLVPFLEPALRRIFSQSPSPPHPSRHRLRNAICRVPF